jgi:hypothetical protein
MRYRRLMAMAIVFSGATFAPAALAQQSGAQPQKWEYKIVNYCDQENQGIDQRDYIERLGEEGWELVSADTLPASETIRCPIQYFKRPKSAYPRQATKPQPQCSVPLDKTPNIRGIHLGMGADELLSLLAPNNNSKLRIENALNNAGPAPNYGVANFTLSPRESAMMETKEKFAGVNFFSFTTFDGRVVEIKVTYDKSRPDIYPSWTIDEWTAKISSAFSLPGPQFWEPFPNDDQRILKCKGLEVEAAVFYSGYPTIPALGIHRTPSLMIIDPSYYQALDQRVKYYQELKQREFVF